MKTVQPMTGAHEVTVGVTQDEYEPLICAAYYHEEYQTPVFLSRWKPSAEERERIAAGEDLYLAVCTFGHPIQPVTLTVGPPEWSGASTTPILPEDIRPDSR